MPARGASHPAHSARRTRACRSSIASPIREEARRRRATPAACGWSTEIDAATNRVHSPVRQVAEVLADPEPAPSSRWSVAKMTVMDASRRVAGRVLPATPRSGGRVPAPQTASGRAPPPGRAPHPSPRAPAGRPRTEQAMRTQDERRAGRSGAASRAHSGGVPPNAARARGRRRGTAAGPRPAPCAGCSGSRRRARVRRRQR